MDVIVGSSRGRNLGVTLKNLFHMENWSVSGAQIYQMEEQVDNHYWLYIFPNPLYPGESTYIYVVGGICDITTKLKNRAEGYQEIVYNKDVSSNISEVMDLYRHLCQHILSRDCIPVISTIVPVSVQKANNFLLDRNKTSVLYHTHEYFTMQNDVMAVCNALNPQIQELNKLQNVHTLSLHTSVFHNVKKGGKKCFQHINLFDGVHPNPTLSNRWEQILKMTIENNRKR
jgi:hypothetical protein